MPLSPEALAKIAEAIPDTYETNPEQFATDYAALQAADPAEERADPHDPPALIRSPAAFARSSAASVVSRSSTAPLARRASADEWLRRARFDGRREGVHPKVDEFTREMIETTSDKKVIEATKQKDLSTVEHLGVLVFGAKSEVEKLTKYMSVNTLGIYGGVNINTQKKAVYEGVDILVGTPGRTMDLALDAVVRFDETQKLVIDEFDEMLNLGFRTQLTDRKSVV